VSGFSAGWLALREPYDLRARSPTVLDAVVTSLKQNLPLRIVDLASGTGSTFRAVSPRLPTPQIWKLIDKDVGLLERALATPRARQVVMTAVPLDIGRDLEMALDGAIDLITISALLDLVSEPWLNQFAGTVAARSLPVYAALSYDGRMTFTPPDPFDAAVIEAVNAHQRLDKGFGAALGPAAAAFAIGRFQALGYSLVYGTSDWAIGRQDRTMQAEILAGWASSAHDLGALPPADISAWVTRRYTLVAAGRSMLNVGHVDFFATQTSLR
jgi:hypothetical protein